MVDGRAVWRLYVAVKTVDSALPGQENDGRRLVNLTVENLIVYTDRGNNFWWYNGKVLVGTLHTAMRK
ncbi:MAG: hypothetical protein U0V74_17605 [Chitinophagales bacterium]